MEQVHKRGLLIIALMVFSLVFALSPSYGSYEEPVSPAKKIESDPLATFKEGDYPVYENSKKIANSEIVTPLDLGETVASPVTVEDEVEEDDDMFFDQAEYDAAPTIKVLAESKRIKYRLIVLQHERFFRDNERKLYVPRLKKQLSVEEFSKHFLEKSQPVIVRFDLMRHLNFTTRAYTLDELLEIYPNHKPMVYRKLPSFMFLTFITRDNRLWGIWTKSRNRPWTCSGNAEKQCRLEEDKNRKKLSQEYKSQSCGYEKTWTKLSSFCFPRDNHDGT